MSVPSPGHRLHYLFLGMHLNQHAKSTDRSGTLKAGGIGSSFPSLPQSMIESAFDNPPLNRYSYPLSLQAEDECGGPSQESPSNRRDE
jgi:hypothetical protein